MLMISAGVASGFRRRTHLTYLRAIPRRPLDSLADLALGVLVDELRLQRDVLGAEVTDARWDGQNLVGHGLSLRRQADPDSLFDAEYRSLRKRFLQARQSANESANDAAEP
jgi:hypothetical protein